MTAPEQAERGDALRLFALGFSILFLELVLIRYLAAHVWNLGYFPNFVLISAFIGMGLGFVFHARLPYERTHAAVVLGAVVLFVLVWVVNFLHPRVPGIEQYGGEIGGEFYLSGQPEVGEDSFSVLVACFALLILTFALIAQCAAKYFRRFPPLVAYTLDIGGSCTGILTFMAMSWWTQSAWVWFALLAPVLTWAISPGGRRVTVACALLLAAVVGLAHQRDTQLLFADDPLTAFEVRWSPYQKIEYAVDQEGHRFVMANGLLHQALTDESLIRNNHYSTPYERYARMHGGKPPRRVLLVGAGTGNDAAAAVLNGAGEVHAVEIDPVVADMGRRHHPARPYSDPRVRLFIDDARSFMTRAEGRYDMLVFGVLDSIVRGSAMSQLRLENYVYTVESLHRASELLTDDGTIAIYNYWRAPWLRTKIEHMLWLATGSRPEVMQEPGGIWLFFADARESDASTPPPSAALEPPSDDWPFMYLRERAMPTMYVIALAFLALLIALLLAALQRNTATVEVGLDKRQRLLLKLAFVLMGTAFLLLETKGVIQLALLFGTTWVNNSLVFLTVLTLVLLANWTASRFHPPQLLHLAFAALFLSSLVPIFYPLSNLLAIESSFLRFVLAGLLIFSPIFFANMLFSLAFREQPAAEHLFGWNLIGATLGGMLEYTSLLFGYNALSVLVTVLYSAVFLLLLFARGRPEPDATEAKADAIAA